MIYTLTLNPSLDYHMTIPHPHPGVSNRAETTSLRFGGKGINVSLVLAEMGVASTALGFVAGFTGEALEAHLRACGLRTDFVRLPEGMTRINVKLREGASETEINAPGMAVPRDCMTALTRQLANLGDGDTLVMAGSMPPTLPADTYARLAEGLPARGVRVAVDTSGAALLAVLPCRPFLIKPNLAELEDAAGRPLQDGSGAPVMSEVAAAAKELQAAGAQNVLVTLGKYGAYLLDADGQEHTALAPQGAVQSTVGAGDSTVAGFLAAWDAHRDYGKALRVAVAAGTATARAEGLADRAGIERVLSEMAQEIL